MEHKIIKEEMVMHGKQEMKAHWAYEKFGLTGDSIVAFCGPVEISSENMIDVKHKKDRDRVFSENMLHFIVEHFDTNTEIAILRQYLLLNILEEKLENRLGEHIILRWGDDLFHEDKKLTVSAVTTTMVSTKIHLGINVIEEDLPPKTRSLEFYDIDPFDLAEAVVEQYRLEDRQIQDKLFRVSPVMKVKFS